MALPRDAVLTVTNRDRASRPGPDLSITTTTPGRVLTLVAGHVEALGARYSLWVRDLDPLAAAMRR